MSDAIDWAKGAAWIKGEVVPIAEAGARRVDAGCRDWMRRPEQRQRGDYHAV